MYQHESSSTWTSPETLDALIFYPDLIRIDWTRCPVIIVDEHNLRDALGITLSYFEMVKSIEETADFVKSYRKLDRRLQKLWTIRKQDLARSTALKSLDFKQWKTEGSDVYSVRLDGNYRAHLRYDRGRTTWYAEGIGNHKAMGHG
jgi:plasmid maintenance system killer protein